MLLANFNRKEHLRHRAVSLRQHGFLVTILQLLFIGPQFIDNGEIETSATFGKFLVAFGKLETLPHGPLETFCCYRCGLPTYTRGMKLNASCQDCDYSSDLGAWRPVFHPSPPCFLEWWAELQSSVSRSSKRVVWL